MTSELRKATAGANGAKSRGPKTPEGKCKSARDTAAWISAPCRKELVSQGPRKFELDTGHTECVHPLLPGPF